MTRQHIDDLVSYVNALLADMQWLSEAWPSGEQTWQVSGRCRLTHEDGSQERVTMVDVTGGPRLDDVQIYVRDAAGRQADHVVAHDPSTVLRHCAVLQRMLKDLLEQPHFVDDLDRYVCAARSGSGSCDCGRDERVRRGLHDFIALLT